MTGFATSGLDTGLLGVTEGGGAGFLIVLVEVVVDNVASSDALNVKLQRKPVRTTELLLHCIL